MGDALELEITIANSRRVAEERRRREEDDWRAAREGIRRAEEDTRVRVEESRRLAASLAALKPRDALNVVSHFSITIVPKMYRISSFSYKLTSVSAEYFVQSQIF